MAMLKIRSNLQMYVLIVLTPRVLVVTETLQGTIDGVGTDTPGKIKTATPDADGGQLMWMTDLLPDEALNIVSNMGRDEAIRSESVKATSGDRTMAMTDGATATGSEIEGSSEAFRKEGDMDEVVIYMPKAEVQTRPYVDPTRNLSTSDTLTFYLNSQATAEPRRNSIGQIMTSSITRNRCDHHFKKLGDGEANGLWPAGKYKCTDCEMIICP